jgi:hypothetical protein
VLTNESWSAIRRGLRPQTKVITAISLPDTYHICSMTSYPPLGQESDALVRRKKVWMKATKF